MKLILIILALVSTKALAVGFLAPQVSDLVRIDVLRHNELRFHIGEPGKISSIKGELDVPPEHVHIFGWLPVQDGGLFTVKLINPDGNLGVWIYSGQYGQVSSGGLPPGHYEYEFTSDGNVADVYWQLLSVGVPDSGFLMTGWMTVMGAMLYFRNDFKRT